MDNNTGLRKELKLSGMIAMAAGGMVAAWMVEIKYWFELSGAGAAVSLLTCAILLYLLGDDQHDAVRRRTEYLDHQRVRLEYRVCFLLADYAALRYGYADSGIRYCQHAGIYVPDHVAAN